MVDTSDIINSKFGDFGVSYAPAQWMKDVGQFFEDVGEAVGEFVDNAIDAVADFANRAITALKVLGESFSFIGDALSNLGDAIGDLFSGDFAGALEDLGDALGLLVDMDNWAAAGDAVLDFFGMNTKALWPSSSEYVNCDDAGIARALGAGLGSKANGGVRSKCFDANAQAAQDMGCALQFQMFQTETKVVPPNSFLCEGVEIVVCEAAVCRLHAPSAGLNR